MKSAAFLGLSRLLGSYFCLDVLVVSIDLALLFVELLGQEGGGSEGFRSARFLRTMRLLRLLRLLRAVKLQQEGMGSCGQYMRL